MYHAADVFAERGAGAEVEGWDSRNLTHDYCLHQGAEVHVSHNTKHGGAEQPNPTRRPLTSLNAAHRIQMQRQKMTPRPRLQLHHTTTGLLDLRFEGWNYCKHRI